MEILYVLNNTYPPKVQNLSNKRLGQIELTLRTYIVGHIVYATCNSAVETNVEWNSVAVVSGLELDGHNLIR